MEAAHVVDVTLHDDGRDVQLNDSVVVVTDAALLDIPPSQEDGDAVLLETLNSSAGGALVMHDAGTGGEVDVGGALEMQDAGTGGEVDVGGEMDRSDVEVDIDVERVSVKVDKLQTDGDDESDDDTVTDDDSIVFLGIVIEEVCNEDGLDSAADAAISFEATLSITLDVVISAFVFAKPLSSHELNDMPAIALLMSETSGDVAVAAEVTDLLAIA